MPTFITLGKWTQEGIENIKQSPARLEAFKKLVESAGGAVKAFYMVTGRYDMVIISEAPDLASVARIALATGSKGSVATETLCALTEEEYRMVISARP